MIDSKKKRLAVNYHDAMTNSIKKQRHEAGILNQRLRRAVGRAIADYRMIEAGDNVMLCVSGGKDSYAMSDILSQLRRTAPLSFDLFAVVVDQGHPGFSAGIVQAALEKMEIPCEIIRQDTYSIVKRVIPEGKTTCGLCSRLRRGILYRVAEERKATKIALGHHSDDIIETLFLNMFNGGVLKAMPPRLQSRDSCHTVIRPLAYCRERDLARYAGDRAYPIIPCTLCPADGGMRGQVKQMLRGWECKYPGRIDSIFSSLTNIAPSHLLDRNLFDFAAAAPAPVIKREEAHVIF